MKQSYLQERKIITKAFWDEISVFNRIILTVSGGIDSTYLFLKFHEQGVKFELFHNHTLRELQTAQYTIQEILRHGNQFYVAYPGDDLAMITRKTKEALKKINMGIIHKVKKNIPCCYYLKEKPYHQWIKQNTDSMDLIVSGLAPYEGMQRNIHLGVLRKRNTYLRFLKQLKRWVAYPLRDMNFQADRKYLEYYVNQFIKTQRSGCYSCPIIALWEDLLIEEDDERRNRSLKVWGHD